MRGTPILVLSGLSLALSTTAQAADPPSTGDVLAELHAANQKEIAAGKMAEKDGKSKQVKDYGKMLVKDHEAADKKVTSLAKDEKINLPPPPAKEMSSMSGMAGDADFDAKFARDMLDDHKKDIAKVTDARNDTTDPKLKKLLSELLPTLQKHEDTAQKIVSAPK